MYWNHLLPYVACCGLLAAAGACGKSAPEAGDHPGEVTYTYDDTYFINPEKGMYLTNVYYFRDGNVPEAVPVDYMRFFRAKNMSLSFSQFYLMDFMEKELSDAVLATIRDDFARHRDAGLKTIVRFCYTYTGTESDEPKEPEVDLVLRHIAQVKPLLQEYADIIYVLQAGFIGSWGEWSFTTHFGDDADRTRVIEALLDALPPTRQVALRTPSFKTRVLGTKLRDSVTVATAFDGSANSRIGGHNDCFLASGNDAGTYLTNVDRALWRADTRYTIMGGETCIPDPDYCNCENAYDNLVRYHWSYLNSAYNTRSLRLLEDGGCLEDVYRRLGYRLYLEKAAFTGDWKAGGTIRMEAVMCNGGFASLMNPRRMELVVDNPEDPGDIAVIPLETDPRRWQGGSRNLWVETFTLPAGLRPRTQYRLYLNLPDPAETLYGRPEFSVRLANTGMWDAERGYNLIDTFTTQP